MAVLWSGCTINRDIMFEPGMISISLLEEMVSQGYRIAPNDALHFRLSLTKASG